MTQFGNNITFQLVNQSFPLRLRVIFPLMASDAAIAQELFGSRTIPITRAESDVVVLNASDVQQLKPEWQRVLYEHVTGHPPDRSQASGGTTERGPRGDMLFVRGRTIVNAGNQADFLRRLYMDGVENIHQDALLRLARGTSERAVAIRVVNARNLLKQRIRAMGPRLWQAIAEWRNLHRYGNPIGPSRRYLINRGITDREIIERVTNTSSWFNRAGRRLRIVGHTVSAVGFVLDATQNSPAAISTPLSHPRDYQIAAERMRLRLHIPPTANIDRHGHQKPANYMQVDVMDPHVEGEFVSETEEIMWFLGIPLTYTHQNNGISYTWTVPGIDSHHPPSWWP